MYADDRVLVGVLQNIQDLQLTLQHGEYRIPVKRWQLEEMEYLAFFLNAKLRKQWLLDICPETNQLHRQDSRNDIGAVCFFAEVFGYELAYRFHILPHETNHPRANDIYYCFKLGQVRELKPPILNESRNRFSFIRTNWRRLTTARHIGQLYAKQRELLA